MAEIVREKIFELYRQEVPYCCTVSVAQHRERRDGQKDFISCVIAVERDSQKGILLGKGGAAIKALMAAARADVEEFLGREVFIEATVKVADGWRDDQARRRRRGAYVQGRHSVTRLRPRVTRAAGAGQPGHRRGVQAAVRRVASRVATRALGHMRPAA